MNINMHVIIIEEKEARQHIIYDCKVMCECILIALIKLDSLWVILQLANEESS